MKTIGMIGGMSWESTVTYYQIINRVVKENLGGLHSAKCLLYSVDFQEIEHCQATGDWQKSAELLGLAAKSVELAGADFIIICTNTMHKVADFVQSQIKIPLLHIADMTADELVTHKISKVALLGTKYTMEQDFYKSRIIAKGVEVLVPEEEDRHIVNSVIYNELCLGVQKPQSKQELLRIVENLTSRGAEGVILGCTEIGLLIEQRDTKTKLFDTAQIHARKAALYAIS